MNNIIWIAIGVAILSAIITITIGISSNKKEKNNKK